MFSFSSNIYPDVELLDNMVALFFNFTRNRHTIPTYISTNTVLSSLSSTSSSTFDTFRLYDSSHYGRHEIMSYCGFDFISLMASNFENIFMCLLVIYIPCLKKKMFMQILCPFLKIGVCLFWYWAVLADYIFCVLTPHWLYHLQTLSPIH